MRVLVDTSVFLRLARDPASLVRDAIQLIEGAEIVFLSAASAWEIALKASIGKLPLPVPASEYVKTRSERMMMTDLPISGALAVAVESLPFHHRDPFDRLLIAQAMLENLTIVTTDRVFAKYGPNVLVSR